MNKTQRFILTVSAVAILVSLFYPPYVIWYSPGKLVHVGHAFLMDPPDRSAAVYIELLLTIWVGIVASAVLLCLAFRKSTDIPNKSDEIIDSKTIRMNIDE